MKVSKEGMKVNESMNDHTGRKYSAKASGGDLAEGLSHKASCKDAGDMYMADDKKQRMPKGHDRIGGKG